MYTYVYVCMYNIHTYIYVCMYVCMCVYIYICAAEKDYVSTTPSLQPRTCLEAWMKAAVGYI